MNTLSEIYTWVGQVWNVGHIGALVRRNGPHKGLGDLWPRPSNSSEIWWSLMRASNFRSAGPTVQPVERKQTGRHTYRRKLQKRLPLSLTREVKIILECILFFKAKLLRVLVHLVNLKNNLKRPMKSFAHNKFSSDGQPMPFAKIQVVLCKAQFLIALGNFWPTLLSIHCEFLIIPCCWYDCCQVFVVERMPR